MIAGGLATSAALLMWTPFPIYFHIAGATILLLIIFFQNRNEAAATDEIK